MNKTSMPNSRRPLSWPALSGLILGLAAIASVVVSGVGYQQGWWPFPRGLQIAEWAAYGAAFGLVLAVIGLIRTRGSQRRGFILAILGVAVTLPLVAMAIHWEYAARAYPPINDISTDTENAPVFWDMPTPTDYPGGETAAKQRAAYPDLVTLQLAIPPDKVFAHALALVEDKGWELVSKAPEEGNIEATVSSLLYGFKDEFAVRITPADGGSKVDVRSRSRLGRIDRGVNAKRIRAYLAELEARAVETSR